MYSSSLDVGGCTNNGCPKDTSILGWGVVLTMDGLRIALVWGWVVVLTMDGLEIAPVWGGWLY